MKPLIGTGFLSAQSHNDASGDVMHITHRSGVRLTTGALHNAYGSFGAVHLYGTKGNLPLKLSDTCHAFRCQLVAFVDMLHTGADYRSADNRLRRVTVRKQGFGSMHADAKGGKFITKPLRFTGDKLVLNYAPSAAGSIQVEILDDKGSPIPGYTQADMPVLYGDELEAVAKWKSGTDLQALAGKSVRLRVVMRDADLYALRFGP